MSTRNNQKTLAVALVCIALAGGAVCLVLWLTVGQARVGGATAEERIASIGRIAADRPRGAAKALARCAATDPAPEVRRAALIGLGCFFPDHRADVEMALSDADGDVRSAAAAALAKFGDDEAAERLATMADDPDRVARLAALRAMGTCHTDKVYVLLLRAAEDHADAEVRFEAMAALFYKLGARFHGKPVEKDSPEWVVAVERAKTRPAVKKAFEKHGVELHARPDRLPAHHD